MTYFKVGPGEWCPDPYVGIAMTVKQVRHKGEPLSLHPIASFPKTLSFDFGTARAMRVAHVHVNLIGRFEAPESRNIMH